MASVGSMFLAITAVANAVIIADRLAVLMSMLSMSMTLRNSLAFPSFLRPNVDQILLPLMYSFANLSTLYVMPAHQLDNIS